MYLERKEIEFWPPMSHLNPRVLQYSTIIGFLLLGCRAKVADALLGVINTDLLLAVILRLLHQNFVLVETL
jgi:hypothetical protein